MANSTEETLARIEQQLSQLMPIVPMVAVLHHDITTMKGDIITIFSSVVQKSLELTQT